MAGIGFSLAECKYLNGILAGHQGFDYYKMHYLWLGGEEILIFLL